MSQTKNYSDKTAVYSIIIIGGGASGLMAAIAAGRAYGTAAGGRGEPILILERMDKPGKKLLATGNGRCNFTNRHMTPACYHSDSKAEISQALDTFGLDETLTLFRQLGIYEKNRGGYLYPRSGQASAVLEVLLTEIARLPVKIQTGQRVTSVKHEKNYRVDTEDGHSFYGKKVILAGGGQAYPKLGSDGSCYDLAKSLGHHMILPVPALTGLYVKEKFMKTVAGVRADGRVTLRIEPGAKEFADEGEIQLTDYGISGIPVFQVSRHGARALQKGQTVTAFVDFMPELSDKALMDLLRERQKANPQKPIAAFLIGLFHEKLGRLFLERSGLYSGKNPGQENKAPLVTGNLTADQMKRLVQVIKGFVLHVEAVGDFPNAQVCAGGVCGYEVDAHMMSRLHKGLYIVGELLDVDGICGGYNLQWAWSSGFIAGEHAARA